MVFWHSLDRLPTPDGGGKTILFATALHEAIQNGLKCLVLAHREELIKQAADKIEIITNEPAGIIIDLTPTGTQFIEIIGRPVELTPELACWLDLSVQQIIVRSRVVRS
jgi:hypothetical protein